MRRGVHGSPGGAGGTDRGRRRRRPGRPAAGGARAGRAVAAPTAPGDIAPACTWVAGVAGPEGLWAGWAGDSRAYWLPDEGPGMTLTVDASTRPSPLGSAPTRAHRCPDPQPPAPGAGASAAVHRRSVALPAHRGGVAIRPYRTRSSGDGLLAEARAPTGYALEAGGHDDVTALLIPVPAAVPRQRP